MLYQVKFTQTASNAVSSFHPDIKKHIKASLKNLALHPYRGKALQEDLFGFLSYRVQRYRIVYKVIDQDKIIIVYMVGHRRNIYELFSKGL
jgi:addiction module RelE/StbE family toxin